MTSNDFQFVLFLTKSVLQRRCISLWEKKVSMDYLLAAEEDVADEPPVPAFSEPILDAVDEQVVRLVHGEQGVLDEQDEEKGLLVLGRPL